MKSITVMADPDRIMRLINKVLNGNFPLLIINNIEVDPENVPQVVLRCTEMLFAAHVFNEFPKPFVIKSPDEEFLMWIKLMY